MISTNEFDRKELTAFVNKLITRWINRADYRKISFVLFDSSILFYLEKKNPRKQVFFFKQKLAHFYVFKYNFIN